MAENFVPNPRQKQAIEHVHGPMLVLAGAGTGKTSVLVERIAYLIENHHAQPEEILAITFTENAAQEMKERVESACAAKLESRPRPSMLIVRESSSATAVIFRC